MLYNVERGSNGGHKSHIYSRMTFGQVVYDSSGSLLDVACGSNGVSWAEPCELDPNLTRPPCVQLEHY